MKEIGEKYKSWWLKRINVCIRSENLLSELDDYLRAIEEVSKNEEYSHLINNSALKKINKISKNFESILKNQENPLYDPKETKIECLDGLNVELMDYNKNGAIKNVIHYNYENNEKNRSGILFLRDDEIIDLVESIGNNSPIPKIALTPQNHTQLIDGNLIQHKKGSLIFTNLGYNLFQKINELYLDNYSGAITKLL
ncbi:MAG: hypothetical protein DRP06_00905 [Candidatus Aenigmatarchaeota archaeon]|nr:MAG: hypothetical protein DRP06_00905 [Candidatus Aenigmarchaeota archaeon]